jgi:hypothetical protein
VSDTQVPPWKSTNPREVAVYEIAQQLHDEVCACGYLARACSAPAHTGQQLRRSSRADHDAAARAWLGGVAVMAAGREAAYAVAVASNCDPCRGTAVDVVDALLDGGHVVLAADLQAAMADDSEWPGSSDARARRKLHRVRALLEPKETNDE